MNNFSIESKLGAVFVWLWKDRLVVLDPDIQPNDQKCILLYFVEGHDLCLLKHNRLNLTPVTNEYEVAFARDQYATWCSMNVGFGIAKKLQADTAAHAMVDNPPPRNKKCPQCDGQASWFDTVNKCTYGVISEGPNIIERCLTCEGKGFVKDIL